ncbi:voltage-dependent anion channel-domain-containing protein [Suillus ampliporus]|nr:voltage-dependent anion channel-domain-containing protein [Suillus ampliporus]
MNRNVDAASLRRKSLKDVVRCVHWLECEGLAYRPHCSDILLQHGLLSRWVSQGAPIHALGILTASRVGTGAIAILFHNFPYASDSPVMRGFTLAFFFFNLVLFLLFSIITAARYILFPGIWSHMIQHPVQSLYIGTFPMGATTLINIASADVFQTYGFGGKPFIYTVWACWWINVVISLACCFGMMHVMSSYRITLQQHSLKSMTTIWLLPVVTLVVGSSSGGVLVPAIQVYSSSYALLTATFSACMVTIGLCLSFMLFTIYILRLIVHGYPTGASILSVFLPVGPCGQAAYSLLKLGSAFRSLLPLNYGDSGGVLRQPGTGETVEVICVVGALVLWSLASMWIVFAMLGLAYTLRRERIDFRLSFWGTIFPNGVYANLNLALATTFSSAFFRIWGSMYAVGTLILWVCIALPTIRMVPSGRIFDAPNFTWAWHTVIMGTGATSALVHAFPYGNGSPAIKVVTLIIFFLNLLLFVFFTGATIARYIMFPDIWLKMIRHPAQSLFIGAFPMGAATLINIALVAHHEWNFGGISFLYTLWGFWMVEQKHTLESMTALWLLPVITLIVASSTGGLLSTALKAQSMKFAILTALFSLTMVTIGLSLALMIISIYLARLITSGPPEKPLVLSAFVALGPLGQGGYSLLINGQNLSEILPLVLKKEGSIPFSIAYQGLIFPNAVFALLSVQLGNVLNSSFFHGFGAVWTVIVFILWLSIFARTIPAVIDRSIFVAPDIAPPPLPLHSIKKLQGAVISIL